MKFVFVALIVLVLAMSVYFFTPREYFEEGETSVVSDAVTTPGVEVSTTEANNTATPAEELLRQQKEQTYKKLEKARRNLDRSVSRLRAILWDKKLPRAHAEAMNKELMSAHALLKNKKLLGAFISLEQIQDELKQVEYSHNKAKEYIEQIRAMADKQD